MPDIDIDFADRDVVLEKIQHRVAKLDSGKKHNTGVYATEIPHNPVDNLATIDYKTAEERGYFKLDFLNVSIYKDVKDEAHLQQLMEKEPQWELLQHNDFTDLIFHISGHGDILQKTKPTNIEQLAAVLAMIRPAKRHLVNETWPTILESVWVAPTDGSYYFKKAHAIAYAVSVVVHMNLLCEQLASEVS
jgi:DNA polymerase III alpha subunit